MRVISWIEILYTKRSNRLKYSQWIRKKNKYINSLQRGSIISIISIVPRYYSHKNKIPTTLNSGKNISKTRKNNVVISFILFQILSDSRLIHEWAELSNRVKFQTNDRNALHSFGRVAFLPPPLTHAVYRSFDISEEGEAMRQLMNTEFLVSSYQRKFN